MGGRVNGRAVPIREQLRNGDIVEITTQKNQTPKSDWLSLVVTSKARNKMKSYMREEQAKHTRMGREELERKLKNWKFAITIDEAVAYLAKYFKLRLGTEVYALIATQKLDFGSIKEILSRHLSGEAEEERRAAAAEIERQKAALHGTQEKAAPQDALVIDDDISKIQYKLAKCCNPIKGDDVFGFVTISAGITLSLIHISLPGQPGSLADAPHRVVVGQRKGVQPAGGAQTDDCGDGKLSPSLLYPEWMWRSYAAIISRGKTRSRRSAPQPRGRSADATPCGGSGSPCGRRTTRRAYRARRPARSAPREASKRG